jgi:photoactive yellow protein
LYHTPEPVSFAEIQRIDSLLPLEFDRLPFGAIKLDRNGIILSVNQTEARLSGRNLGALLGRNFFTEVAPCTNVQEFAGRFREGVENGQLHTVFPFLFDFEMEPRRVWITLFYSRDYGSAWVFTLDDRE